MSRSSLKDIKIFLEQAERELYAEPKPDNPLPKNLKLQYSADNRIDSFLIKFEAESQVPEEDKIMESLESLNLSTLLEQDDSPAEEAEASEAGDAEEAEAETADSTEPVGSERVEAEDPIEAPKLPLDVDAFSARVGKLILNADVLLDLKTVIVNRALKFLTDNYDEAHAKRLLESLDGQFDIEIDDSSSPREDNYAVGAYAGGTGGLGGGGG